MIVDEKALNPPPPYTKATPATAWRTFSALPPHLLLQIVYATFSEAYEIEDAVEQRKTLYWLTIGLRLVNRLFYTTSMNVLRSVYLPLYDSLIRRPNSSDPFPHSNSLSMRSSSPVGTLQRETVVLDLYIALKVREDVWLDESSLHLEREESFRDLFDRMQPRSRLEDLVRDYGVGEGVIYVDSQTRSGSPAASTSDLLRPTGESSSSVPARPTSVVLRSQGSQAVLTAQYRNLLAVSTNSNNSFWRMTMGKGKSRTVDLPPPPSMKVVISPLPFSTISIMFSTRSAGLMVTNGRFKRTIVEVPRRKDEALEVAATRLVWALRDWLVDEADRS